ncbi:MAG: beta strand repeat-containing protein, partial [Bacteroidia bacterium]
MNLMFTTSFIKNIASDEASDIACCLLKKALLFICLLCCFSGEIMGVNYTVNSTADPGTGSGTTGSLRYCITTANATAGSHTISFSGLAAGSTIALSPTAGGLPDITRTMVIDATTTSGWTSNTIGINLDATNNSGNQVFNVLNVPGVEIYGFQIIGGASTSFGILINGDNADNFKIGAINKRNVINRAGNTIIKVISADNGFVQNNYLGCDVTGTFGYYGTPAGTPPASGSGLWLTDGANGNTIGGSTAGQGNLIAGGAGYGILLGLTGDLSPGLSGCSNNIIYGNRVGGTGTLGNYSCVGIYLDGNSDNNIIGGVLPGQANDLSNHQSTSESSCDGVGGSAVRIRSAEAEGNTIRGNIMQCASSMGIRLQSTGSNNNQPSPSIAGFNTTTNVLSGTVSTPNAIIDVYLGDNCNGDYTTNIKGKQYLASATADGSGNWSIDLTSFICILNNQYVTATATHPTNNSTGQFAIGFLINLSLPVINYAPGTYSVGPSGTFCSLQSVASFLNTYSVSGAYVFEIQPTYNANTETTPIIFNNNSGSSASNTVTIRPAASVTTPIIIQGQNPDWSDPVTGSTDANALIIINGLDYFTLDGRSGGVGTARNLTISNTGSFHSAVSVTNNADYVTIRNCSMLSGMPKRTLAVVSIISNSTAQGNDFVTIQNNNISSNYIGASIWSKYPRSGIYCKSTAATTGINNNITIRDNNIFDIKDANVDGNGNCAAGSGGFGMIHFTANNNAFTVEGNSLYQTNSEWGDCGSSGSTNIYGIYVTSTTSNNNIVRNNFIGGSGPLCAGTWTMPAMTAQIRFNAIHFAPTGNTPTSGTYATITGNTIKNISWNTRSVLVNTALAPAVFSGISVFGAGTGTRNVVIGTNGEGNTIGDNTTTGSILVRNTATSGNGMNIVGISVQGINSGTTTIEHNNIGSITSSTSGIVSTIEGIRVNDGQNIVRFNTIGSTSVSNSFNIVTAATTHAVANNGIQRVRGIVHAGGTAGTASSTVANNTISNLTVNYAANTSGTCGIAIENPTATNVRGAIQIQNNTIRDISYTQARSGTVGLNAAVASTTITGTGVGASVFTGTIATNLTLDVTAMTSGSIVVGQIISGTNIPAGTFISAVVPGTFGGVGQYTVALNLNIPSQSMTAGASNFTGSITGNRLNITAIASGGNPAANTLITGAGITNLRTSATAPTFTTTAATSPNVAGIALSLAGNSENVVTNISGNTIHSLRTNCWQATTGGAVDVVGIHYNGRTAGVQTINGNFIRDFVPSTSFENQSGIVAAGGVATYSNNIIFLGNGVSTHPSINGISETGGNNQFYFNTARIVGVPTGTATNSTFAFVSTVNAGTRNIRNNIFANARSSFVDATSRHYAISLIGNTGLTINYNNYVASGANGAVLGRYNADNKTSLANWQTSTTQDANSQSINPAFFGPGSSAMQNRPSGTGIISGAAGTGITTDFGGSYRTCSNALGAIEVEVGGALLPNITITQPAALCGSGTVNLTTLTVTDANNTIGTLSYFSSLADAIAGTPTLASPTSVGAGTYFIRKTKTSGCGYDIKPVTVTINSLPTPTFTVSSSN